MIGRAGYVATRPLVTRVRRHDRVRRVYDGVIRTSVLAPLVRLWRRLWPIVTSPEGGFMLVDALGVRTAEVLDAIPGGLLHRVVIMTDDPDVASVRVRGVLYEFLPRQVSADPEQVELRVAHFQRVYNAAAPVRPGSIRSAAGLMEGLIRRKGGGHGSTEEVSG